MHSECVHHSLSQVIAGPVGSRANRHVLHIVAGRGAARAAAVGSRDGAVGVLGEEEGVDELGRRADLRDVLVVVRACQCMCKWAAACLYASMHCV